MIRMVTIFALAGLLPACRPGPTDPGACSPVCNSDKTGCGALGSNLTALGALHAAEPLAQKILGATPRWVGVFEGLEITRQGQPSQTPDTVNVLGQQTNIYVAGWVFKYCAAMNDVVFGAGPQTSSAQQGCQDINCDAVADTAEPAVDSAAAITTAFPADPAATLYNLELAPAANQGKRFWAVTQRPSGPTVKVDADTGAIVP